MMNPFKAARWRTQTRWPITFQLVNFDFRCIPSLNRQTVDKDAALNFRAADLCELKQISDDQTCWLMASFCSTRISCNAFSGRSMQQIRGATREQCADRKQKIGTTTEIAECSQSIRRFRPAFSDLPKSHKQIKAV